MTITELMKDVTPDPEFEGFSTANDMVLAIDFAGNATDPKTYTVAQMGITEQTGALAAETKESVYIRTGKVTAKTGTSRTFTVTGDRYHKDAFQDALLAHSLKYGTGQDVVRPYVYFDRLTGKGEQGKVSISIESDLTGTAGENATFSATLTSVGVPQEYTYTVGA